MHVVDEKATQRGRGGGDLQPQGAYGPSAEHDLGFWPTPETLAGSLRQALQNLLCYELAPTGRVHAGIVRTLLYAESLREVLATAGGSVCLVLRINDRAGAKGPLAAPSSRGVPIAASLPAQSGRSLSALEELLDDLEVCSRRIGVRIDRIELVSSIYASTRFRDLVIASLNKAGEIRQALAMHQTSPIILFRPACEKCRYMYCVDFTAESWAGYGTYACRRCGHVGTFSADISEGLLAFKLESAIMWEYFHADVDLHGQDHIEAFRVSCALSGLLSTRAPLPGRVNLTFNSSGNALSKSNNNFVPVAELSVTLVERLRGIIMATPWSQPLLLPSGY